MYVSSRAGYNRGMEDGDWTYLQVTTFRPAFRIRSRERVATGRWGMLDTQQGHFHF